MRCSTVMVIVMLMCSVVYHLTFLFKDFVALLILSLVYGLIGSTFWALQTLVIIEILGMKLFAPAMGFYSFLGIFSGLAFPFEGFLKDLTGTYSSTFHFFGFLYMIGA